MSDRTQSYGDYLYFCRRCRMHFYGRRCSTGSEPELMSCSEPGCGQPFWTGCHNVNHPLGQTITVGIDEHHPVAGHIIRLDGKVEEW